MGGALLMSLRRHSSVQSGNIRKVDSNSFKISKEWAHMKDGICTWLASYFLDLCIWNDKSHINEFYNHILGFYLCHLHDNNNG